jgi:hypothetical protein
MKNRENKKHTHHKHSWLPCEQPETENHAQRERQTVGPPLAATRGARHRKPRPLSPADHRPPWLLHVAAREPKCIVSILQAHISCRIYIEQRAQHPQ